MAGERKKQGLTKREMLAAGISIGSIALADRMTNGGLSDIVGDAGRSVAGVTAPPFDNSSQVARCAPQKVRGRAWILVHRGFIENKSGVEKSIDLNYDQQEYAKYKGNTSQLEKHLKKSGEPTIIVQESESYIKSPARQINSCTSTMVSVGASGTPKKYVTTKKGLRQQDLRQMKADLKRQGVKQINVAGEIGVHKTLGKGGCVDAVARNFDGDFAVRGVEGCIYPLTKPTSPDRVQRNLYERTVKVPK